MKNLELWELYLWRQGKLYNHASVIGVGNEQSNYQAVEKLDDSGKLAINVSNQLTDYSFRTYATNNQGKRTELKRDKKNFDPRLRTWYKAAVIAGKPTWSEIYPNIDRQTLNIAAVHPVYDVNNRLEGVLLVTQRLFRLGEYLRSLKIGRTGKAFIIERSGLIIATSSDEQPFRKNNDTAQRLRASESSDSLTQATAKFLSTRFLRLNQIKSSQQLEFAVDGKRQFVQVLPFQDDKGLDWLIVVVVPEADFMEQINANTHTTIVLCMATFIVATGIGIVTARWITQPILRLNTAAKEIAQGKWDTTIAIQRADEVGQLAESFKSMVAQLQESFVALQESESHLTQFLEAVPVGVTVHDVMGKPTYANQAAKQIMGIDTLPDTKIDCLAEDYLVYLSGTEQLYPIEKLPVVKALSGACSFVDDMELRRADRIVPLEVWATPIYDETGKIAYAIVAFADITERKQSQQLLADYNHRLEQQVAQRTAAVQESEAVLKAAQRVAHVGSWEFDVMIGKMTWSEEQFRIFGLDPTQPEPTYDQYIQQIHPDERVLLQQSQAQMMATGKAEELDFRIVRPNGEVRYVSGRGEAVVNEQGQVIKLFGTTMDITARKQAEDALRESTVREQAIAKAIQRMRQTLDTETIFSATTHELRQAIHCDRVAVYRFNPDWSGEFVYESVNNEWIPLVQAQAHNPTLKQKTIEDQHCTVTSFDSEAEADNFLGTASTVQDTYLQRTQGGAYSRGATHVAVSDIYKAGFDSCYINLLERFQARAYIIVPIFSGSKLWGLLATYQNSSPRQWKTTEINGVIQISNQFGVALQQAELLTRTQRQSEALQKSEAREREKAQALEIALDELRRTQVQLVQSEKMSSLGQMVAGIAHEINNPISFVYGNLTPARHYFQELLNLLELYQKTYPDTTPEIQQLTSEIDFDFLLEDWKKLMDSMQTGAERIREIVCGLRNFSRLDENDLKLVDIHEGIDNTLLILQHRLRSECGGLEIQVTKEYGQLPKVTCYASQLNQVFMNLLSNAIDALEHQPEPRTITISTSLSHYQSPVVSDKQQTTNFVAIRIADNGSGMSEDVQKKIFDPFFTTKSVGSGTGLGLSISYQIIVEKHQGQISCISAPGQGTEIIVEIPTAFNLKRLEYYESKIQNCRAKK